MILYAAIDIRAGRTVRLLQGDYEQETRYDTDPLDAALRFVGDGAQYLHVIDLDGAREGRPVNTGQVRRIVEATQVPVQVGGGLRSASAVEEVLRLGAARVVLGTAALRDPELLAGVLEIHDERVVVSVDARGGRVSLSGWTEQSDAKAAEAVATLAKRGVRRLIYTPIEVDGTMQGPQLAELRDVAGSTSAELIYSGGIGQLSDLRLLTDAAPPNLGGVIVGRALYEGRFTVAEGQAALA